MTRSLSAYARSQGKRRSLTIPRWTNHDIRRTFRTELSALGGKVEHDVKEALLAHTKKGIIAVYDQYKFLDEKRTALLLWSDRLRAILNAPMGSLEKFQH